MPEACELAEAAAEFATAGLEAGVAGWLEDAAVVGCAVCSDGTVAGLIVATESIAPATRQTARMLASSGMMDPRAANGEASRRILLRRRFARSSR
ncbi:MAG: hypothetical protein WAK82_26930 [Streptosporangiaceae bacterium]